MVKHISILTVITFLTFIFILSSLTNINEISAETIQSNANKTTHEESMTDQTNTFKPEISIRIPCMMAQGYLPSEFTATGFTPNSDVIVEINKNSVIETEPSEPIRLLLKADSTGKVTGGFVLDREINEDYFLHLYSFSGPPQEEVSTLIGSC